MKEKLTKAQEQRVIELFNNFLSDENRYLEMVMTFQAMQKQYLLSYECDSLNDDPKDRLHVVLDSFNYLLSVPLFEVRITPSV